MEKLTEGPRILLNLKLKAKLLSSKTQEPKCCQTNPLAPKWYQTKL